MMTTCLRWLTAFGILAAALCFSAPARAWQMKQAPLMTRWAALVDTNNPLPEYPRPQMVRSNWMSLNGLWQFQPGTGTDPVPTNKTLSSAILVPYPMESALSGVMQYNPWSWYRRTFNLPADWSGRRIILHLDAVTWQARVFINGHSLGTHQGGYDPFSYDITPYLNGAGAQEIIVEVYSPEDNGSQPRGKQTLYPGGIMYTSSSGIWQPVWLEPVDASGVQSLLIVPDVDNARLRLTVNAYSSTGVTVHATALDGSTPVASASGAPGAELDLSLPNPKLWSPDNPFLYNLNIVLTHNGVTNDTVSSYFGMRKISINVVNGQPKIFLNNHEQFGIGPLDQGFWPDGIYTAPTDDALKYDLQEEKALGFNMVRKHIKVERQRWYYWADTLGLMVWQDMPSCNSYTGNPSPPAVNAADFEAELSAMVQTHINSPCIIMWDIFNEGQGQEGSGNGVGQATTASLVQLVKGLDPSRLVNQASGGNYFGVGDIFDNHSYPAPGDPTSSAQAPVDGEYGGIGFQVAGHLWNPSLAGGDYIGATSTADIAPIYDSFVNDIVNYKADGLNAAVYTQITDVENECNGLMTYDRYLKPDPTRITASNEKAISGAVSETTLLADSASQHHVWKYTTNTSVASTNWFATNDNDAAWNSGPAPFGANDPGVVTPWTTSDIWIRQTFPLGTITALESNDLAFTVFHDEDCEIYLNGVLAASATGYTTSYVPLPLNSAGKAALIQNGQNLLAIHCHQTTGGQEIDAGLVSYSLTANTLAVPADSIGYWPLDETSGDVAADVSGSGLNGIVHGAGWNPTGKVHGCLGFNGVNNYVQVPRAVSNDFSLAAWVKTTSTGGSSSWSQGQGLVTSVAVGTGSFGLTLVGGNVAFGLGLPGTTLVSTNPINDGSWHYCVATRTQATGAMALYVDGILQATATGSTNTMASSPTILFGAMQTNAGFFSGDLDEIQIFNRALGNLEIAAAYGDLAVPPPAPTNLAAIVSNGGVSLSWWTAPLAQSYHVGRSTTPGGPYTLIAIVTSPSYVDTQVAEGQTYYYAVSSVDDAGAGPYSAGVSARPSLLAAWFRADSLSNLANGAPIATWPDLSGLGNDATQANAAQRPTFSSTAFHGLPGVHFNSASSTYLSFSRAVQDDFTIACVFQSAQGLNTGAYYYQGAGLVNAEVANVVPDFGSCLFSDGTISAGTGDPDVSINSGPGYNDGKPHEFILERSESSGSVSLYVDGALAGSVTGGTEPLTAPSVIVMGAQQTLLYFLTGDLAEVRVYDVALSDAARQALDTELRVKYLALQPPTLRATVQNRAVTLSWPAGAGFTLYTSTNLSPPIAWSPVTNAPTLNNGTNALGLAATNSAQFFELLFP